MDKKQILEALKDTINKITNPYETSKENSEDDDGGTTIQVDNEDDIVDLGSQEVEFPKHLIQTPHPPEGTHAEWNEFIPGYLPLMKKKDEEETKAPSSIADVYARDPRFAPQEPNAGLKLGMGGNRIANNIISGIKATDAEMKFAEKIKQAFRPYGSEFSPVKPASSDKLPEQPMDRAVRQFKNREEEQKVVNDFNQQTKSTLSPEDQKKKAEFDQYQKDYDQYQKDYDQWAKDNPEALKQRLRQQRKEFHGKDPAHVTTTGDEIYNPEIAAKVKAQEQQITQMNANTAAMNAESEKIQKELDRLARGEPSEAYERKRLGIPDDGSRRPDTRLTWEKLPMGGGRMAEENSYYYRRLANLFEETRFDNLSKGLDINRAAYAKRGKGPAAVRSARASLANSSSGGAGDSSESTPDRPQTKSATTGNGPDPDWFTHKAVMDIMGRAQDKKIELSSGEAHRMARTLLQQHRENPSLHRQYLPAAGELRPRFPDPLEALKKLQSKMSNPD